MFEAARPGSTRLQNGVLDNYVTPLIAADRLTAAGLLEQHSYHMACLGKWQLEFTVDLDTRKGKAEKTRLFERARLGAHSRWTGHTGLTCCSASTTHA